VGGHLLNPQIILLDVTSIPAILVGVATLGLGLAVFIRERGSSVGTRYLFFAAAIAVYIIGAGFSYAVTTPILARFWHRVAHTGAVAIPLAMVVSALVILGQAGRYRAAVATVGVVTVVLQMFVWFTDLLLGGVREVSWGWYPVYGPVGYAYIVFFTIVGLWVVFIHARELARSTVSLHRKRIGMSVLALSLGLVGGVDFWPAIGADMYAFGYVPISIYVAIMAWVIVRYRLVDVTPEVAATSILNTMQGAIIVTDLGGVIRVANRQANAWLASNQRRLQDKDLHHVLTGRSRKVSSAAQQVAGIASPVDGDERGPLSSGQYEWTADSGKTRMVDVAATPLRIGSEVIGTVYAAHDVTPHKDTERVLAELALHDPLTGLPNRVLLFEQIEQWIRLADRSKKHLGVFFVDLDKFKAINDTRGHETGDQVLKAVADRLRSATRDSDTVARIGGDEFVIVAGALGDETCSTQIAEKIRSRVAEPICVGGYTVEVGASVGIALYPGDGADAESLVRSADAKMYQVKARNAARP
jgi:diguanylate cyclase (GGDEF)-like protein/PAS domain S-box-containing protein